MKYVILVTCPPHTYQGGVTALHFSQALLERGHELIQVFFYADGVYNANAWTTAVDAVTPLAQQWQDFAAKASVKLGVCIAAALKRGILDEAEAQRLNQNTHNLAPGFVLCGLGEFMESLSSADRVITFT